MNPAGERKVERFGWTFAPGDKVMQVENDYDKEVYNGDIGFVEDVDSEVGNLTASFDGRSVTYGFGELDMLVPSVFWPAWERGPCNVPHSFGGYSWLLGSAGTGRPVGGMRARVMRASTCRRQRVGPLR